MFRISWSFRRFALALAAVLAGLTSGASAAATAESAATSPTVAASAAPPTTPTVTAPPEALAQPSPLPLEPMAQPRDEGVMAPPEGQIQPEFPPEIRDDPSLPEEERMRRHALRLQFLRDQRLRQGAAMQQQIEAEAAAQRVGFGYAVIGYFHDRLLDFCDFFRVRVHVPRGFRSVGIKARATVLAQAGFIYVDGQNAGIDRRGVGIWKEKRTEGGLGPLYFSRVHNEMIAGNRFTDVDYAWSVLHDRGIVRNGSKWDDGRRHPLSCGAELQLFFFGIELETYPVEYLDAVFGWIGLDPYQDDETRLLRRWMEIQRVPELQVSTEWVNTLREQAPQEKTGAEKPAEKPGETPAEKPAP